MAIIPRSSIARCLLVMIPLLTSACTTVTITAPQTPRQQRAATGDVSRENESLAPATVPRDADQPEGIESRLVPEMVELLNAVRQQSQSCGEETFAAVQSLRWDEALGSAALDHAEDLAVHIIRGHVGSDGSHLRHRVERYSDRFGRLGETIALGSTSPERAVNNLLRSEAHCRILMTAEYNRLGVAWSENRHEYPYYVLVLGRIY